MRYSRRCTSNGFRAAGPRCGGFSSVMISSIKKSLCAAERHRKDVARARRRWIQQQGFLDTTRLVFIDETAITTNMVRVRGRCPRGERLVSHVPQGERKTITFIAALRLLYTDALELSYRHFLVQNAATTSATPA